MGTISSNIGLITGFPIQDTVEKLIALQAAPRDALTATNKTLTDKQTAFTTLAALLTGLQIGATKLTGNLLYSEQNVTSSNPSLLGVTATGPVALGTYQFTPIRQAQTQQFTSTRIASATAPLGGGSLAVRFGGFVDRGASLDLINGGEGFERGTIRIINRAGQSADIDLSFARSIDDVLSAINSSDIHVTAQAVDGRLRLDDTSQGNASNLRVLDVGGGTTAASLGLAGINVAASTADGAAILRLFDQLDLTQLNLGTGVRFDDALEDLHVTFRDGTSTNIDFQRLAIAGTRATGATSPADAGAKLTFTAVNAGSAYAGVQVVFQNDNSVVAGSNESVAYDEHAKTLTLRIREGQTTAANVVEALKRNPVVSPLFTATAAAGDGTALVSALDTATLNGLPATAITSGTNGENARLLFTAVTAGAAADGVTIEFVHNANIQPGQETVAYDDSNPLDKRLTFQIAEGQTTADGIIAALAADSAASQVFVAARLTGGDGQGLISQTDTAVTAGGALIEPVAATNEITLGDVLATLNTVAPGKLHAEIAADGTRLLLTDLTSDNGGTFGVADLNGSHAAADLGLTAPASGGALTGGRILAGLKTSLLANLNGGQGISGLGIVNLTDRSGVSASIDLSQAESIDDVLGAINSAGLGIVARVNSARDGLELVDTTGATSSNLVVANGDATNSADRLGIAVNAAVSQIDGGSLRPTVVNQNTLLSSFNGGRGVALGKFTVTDTLGHSATANILAGRKSVGDVIDELNSLGLAIHASINDAGDGIAIVDTAHGAETLQIAESGSTTAADLHLLGGSQSVDIGGQPTQQVDGSTTFSLTLAANESLNDLVQKINAAKIGVTASIFNDGSSVKPLRLILASQVAGKAGELRVDAIGLPFALSESVKAQDALLMANTPGTAGLLASSSTNTFEGVLPGAKLTVNGSSASPVTISVTGTSATLAASVLALVDGYNKVHDKIKELTAFDANEGKGSLLSGDATSLRIESDLAELFTRRLFGAGNVQTLAELGITVTQDGAMVFDQDAFTQKFNADPSGVQKFFTSEKTGFAARVKALAEQLAGPRNSVLTNRNESLKRTLENNQGRIDRINRHLDAARLRLLVAFYQSEQLIAKIKNNLNALSAISVPTLSAPSGSTN